MLVAHPPDAAQFAGRGEDEIAGLELLDRNVASGRTYQRASGEAEW